MLAKNMANEMESGGGQVPKHGTHARIKSDSCGCTRVEKGFPRLRLKPIFRVAIRLVCLGMGSIKFNVWRKWILTVS